MTELIAYGMLALTAIGACAVVVAAGCLALAAIRLLQNLAHRRAARPAPAPAAAAAPGTVAWWPCHTTICGHMQSRHDLTADGRWVCSRCRTTREGA
ncbi:hypothetical protein [Streptomyces sp. NPDC095602]|uniref:hypothetical protein n=1 Tax=Streptomyces sp. NPDC095602 TaxID=3155819 RepID=UPI00332AB847